MKTSFSLKVILGGKMLINIPILMKKYYNNMRLFGNCCRKGLNSFKPFF